MVWAHLSTALSWGNARPLASLLLPIDHISIVTHFTVVLFHSYQDPRVLGKIKFKENQGSLQQTWQQGGVAARHRPAAGRGVGGEAAQLETEEPAPPLDGVRGGACPPRAPFSGPQPTGLLPALLKDRSQG